MNVEEDIRNNVVNELRALQKLGEDYLELQSKKSDLRKEQLAWIEENLVKKDSSIKTILAKEVFFIDQLGRIDDEVSKLFHETATIPLKIASYFFPQ